jgi:hypothetical protein
VGLKYVVAEAKGAVASSKSDDSVRLKIPQLPTLGSSSSSLFGKGKTEPCSILLRAERETNNLPVIRWIKGNRRP